MEVKLKSFLFITVPILLILGCTSTTTPISKKKVVINNTPNQVQMDETQDISYQEIITRINDINTSNKDNTRVKEIIKDYSYNTSDDDSKNSARVKALNQVKVLILEEIGVFVESYLEINQFVSNQNTKNAFRQEIKTVTAGIIKTKILEEKYDGQSFYVKASVLVDPDSVSEGISELLKIRANKGDIVKLESLLIEKSEEVDLRSSQVINLQKKLATQAIIESSQEHELSKIRLELKKAETLLRKYQAEHRVIESRLDQIRSIIRSKTNKVLNYVERGMTLNEVREMAGKERSTGDAYPGERMFNYGNVWVQMVNGVVGCVSKLSCEKTSCKYYGKNTAYPPRSCVVK
jgi:hypothetical protein